MSSSKAFRAALILLFGFGVFIAAQPIGASDAEAKRGFGAASIAGARVINRSGKEKKEEGEEANQADEDEGAEEAKSAESESEKAAVVTPAPVPAAPAVVLKPQDPDVPGCSTGMLCIVCVAGCNGPTNGIIHATPKPLR